MEETFDLTSFIPEEEQQLLEEMLRGDPENIVGQGASEADKITEAIVPVVGKPMCPVPACLGDKFTRTTRLRRHWCMVHMPTVAMYHCVVEDCRVRHPRHPRADNRKFVQPGMAPPASVGEVLAPEANNISVKKIPSTWRTLGPAPKQDLESPKKTKREDIPACTHSKILRTVIMNKQEEEEDIIRQVPQKELMFRFYKNQAEMEKLGRQNRRLNAELKRRELGEASINKDKIKELLQEIQDQKDIIRKRDRTIRHLESEEDIL